MKFVIILVLFSLTTTQIFGLLGGLFDGGSSQTTTIQLAVPSSSTTTTITGTTSNVQTTSTSRPLTTAGTVSSAQTTTTLLPTTATVSTGSTSSAQTVSNQPSTTTGFPSLGASTASQQLGLNVSLNISLGLPTIAVPLDLPTIALPTLATIGFPEHDHDASSTQSMSGTTTQSLFPSSTTTQSFLPSSTATSQQPSSGSTGLAQTTTHGGYSSTSTNSGHGMTSSTIANTPSGPTTQTNQVSSIPVHTTTTVQHGVSSSTQATVHSTTYLPGNNPNYTRPPLARSTNAFTGDPYVWELNNHPTRYRRAACSCNIDSLTLTPNTTNSAVVTTCGNQQIVLSCLQYGSACELWATNLVESARVYVACPTCYGHQPGENYTIACLGESKTYNCPNLSPSKWPTYVQNASALTCEGSCAVDGEIILDGAQFSIPCGDSFIQARCKNGVVENIGKCCNIINWGGYLNTTASVPFGTAVQNKCFKDTFDFTCDSEFYDLRYNFMRFHSQLNVHLGNHQSSSDYCQLPPITDKPEILYSGRCYYDTAAIECTHGYLLNDGNNYVIRSLVPCHGKHSWKCERVPGVCLFETEGVAFRILDDYQVEVTCSGRINKVSLLELFNTKQRIINGTNWYQRIITTHCDDVCILDGTVQTLKVDQSADYQSSGKVLHAQCDHGFTRCNGEISNVNGENVTSFCFNNDTTFKVIIGKTGFELPSVSGDYPLYKVVRSCSSILQIIIDNSEKLVDTFQDLDGTIYLRLALEIPDTGCFDTELSDYIPRHGDRERFFENLGYSKYRDVTIEFAEPVCRRLSNYAPEAIVIDAIQPAVDSQDCTNEKLANQLNATRKEVIITPQVVNPGMPCETNCAHLDCCFNHPAKPVWGCNELTDYLLVNANETGERRLNMYHSCSCYPPAGNERCDETAGQLTNINQAPGNSHLVHVKIKFGQVYNVTEAIIWNRADCCQDRANGLKVYIGGHLAPFRYSYETNVVNFNLDSRGNCYIRIRFYPEWIGIMGSDFSLESDSTVLNLSEVQLFGI